MTAAAAGTGEGGTVLPRLRRGLRLDLVAPDDGGWPALTINDMVCANYFKLEWPQSGLVLMWNEATTSKALAEKLFREYGTAATEEDIGHVAGFLIRNELTETDDKGGWQRYAERASASRHGILKTLVHNYLFFRLPLFHPDRVLGRMLPHTAFLFATWFWWLIAGVATCGLYLTTRQWSDVVASLEKALQFQQLLLYAAALLILKLIHEMGHALTAARYGCRVPTMGIAIILGAPVFYTDTTDSWRLTDHRKRLNIVFAGVAAESIVAAFALLAWPLLPEGPTREILFGFATAAIAMSVAINLNPMMRYDGYFALSDYLQVANLQPRAFAISSWHMREVLFGIGAPPPERFAPHMRNVVLIYAYATMIYRFFLFLGIAAIVYHMAGKALGIVLGLFEIVVFILLPIWREIRGWWGLRREMRTRRRARFTIAAATATLIVAAVPCIGTAESPGVLIAADEQELHVAEPALLTTVAVHGGELVTAGQLLFEARSPELDHTLRKAKLDERLLKLRMARLMGSQTEHSQALVIKRSYLSARQKVEGLEKKRTALRVTAPFQGRIVDFDTALQPGCWVSAEQVLARVASTGGAIVRALISDKDVTRISPGAKGTFIADDAGLAARAVTLTSVAPASNGELAEPVLADVHGGLVGAEKGDRGLKAREGWIEARYRVDGMAPRQLVRGIVRVDAERQSPLAVAWRQIGRVLVREQGF